MLVPNPHYAGHRSLVNRLVFAYESSTMAEFSALKAGTVNLGYLDTTQLGAAGQLTQQGDKERLGITLLWLRTYSPNLNLIERLWKFVKAECLHGRDYATFAPFKQAIIDCLQDPEGRHKAKLATLLTLKFQLVDTAA